MLWSGYRGKESLARETMCSRALRQDTSKLEWRMYEREGWEMMLRKLGRNK